MRGLVSIIRDGTVVMKLVAHDGGDRAGLLAAKVGKSRCVPTVGEAFAEAQLLGFGGTEGLVIVTSRDIQHNRRGVSRFVAGLYRRGFDDSGGFSFQVVLILAGGRPSRER
ncbi:MAG: hypothetical protein UY73_C0039G0012 [Parcubacteria group bacterium GW2011_GWA2_52_8]|nr:MAG: hypothetical protein UY73_C0039G0012 [Parcubacteria group bacterium GW2011_GWA2_52_8]